MPKPRGVGLKLGLLLRQSHQRAVGTLNTALSTLRVMGRPFGMMMLLRPNGVSIQRDLIRQTDSDKAGMVRAVEDLENLGDLRRSQFVRDKRVADLNLTDMGVEAFDSAQRLVSSAAEELFGSFTPAELETLETLLTRFVSASEREDHA